MDINTLKEALQKEQEHLAANDGNVLLMGPDGPIGIKLAKAFIEMLEVQQREIDDLKRRLNVSAVRHPPLE